MWLWEWDKETLDYQVVKCSITNTYKNNKKTFPIKMEEDVGMSKPKNHANKVRWDPKLNKPLPYNPT